MEPVASFFTANMIAVYFVYGLAFFALGLAVIVESGRASQSPLIMDKLNLHSRTDLVKYAIRKGLIDIDS